MNESPSETGPAPSSSEGSLDSDLQPTAAMFVYDLRDETALILLVDMPGGDLSPCQHEIVSDIILPSWGDQTLFFPNGGGGKRI